MKVSVDLLISKENENNFKHELEQLKNKYHLLKKDDSIQEDKEIQENKNEIQTDKGEENNKIQTDKPVKTIQPKTIQTTTTNKYLSMMMSNSKKKKKDDADNFDNLKTNCWKMYGFKKNIIGEKFQDDPDNSNLFHKIIGFQPKNQKTPVITLDDNGIRKKWTIDQICIFLGIPRGYIIEELISKVQNPVNQTPEILKSKIEEPFVESPNEEIDENENKYSRDDTTIYVNVKGTLNTPVKCKHHIIIRPENYRCKDKNEKVKHRRAGMPAMKKRTEVKPDIPIREKKSHSELSEMNDTELSLYYGFDKNMVGTIFNQPTPKKGYERLHKITGFNIIKEKYVVVAYCYHTKKSLHFSVEHIQELIENQKEKDKIEEKNKEKEEIIEEKKEENKEKKKEEKKEKKKAEKNGEKKEKKAEKNEEKIKFIQKKII